MEPRLRQNFDALFARVERAASAAGRAPEAVRVVAVTKSVATDLALDLARCGCVDLGENRVDELERKATAFAAERVRVRWHFVGHLQRNKARRVLRLADEIHSIDSERLLDALERIVAEEGRAPGIYLQVKLADEETKDGLGEDEARALVARAGDGPLPLLGLMGMAPLAGSASDAFARLARFAATLSARSFEDARPRLSMGMSGDLEQAIAAGADVVRVGGAFFEGLPRRSGARVEEAR